MVLVNDKKPQTPKPKVNIKSEGGNKMLTVKKEKEFKKEQINKIKSLSSEILKLMQDNNLSNEEAKVLLNFVEIEYEFLK